MKINIIKISINLLLILLLFFVIPYQNSWAYSSDNLSNISKTYKCNVDSKIKNFTVLDINLTTPCLNDIFKLDKLLPLLEQPIKNKTGDKLSLTNLTYEIIDNGIKIKGNAKIKTPVIGEIQTEITQDLLLSISQGILYIASGKTELGFVKNLSLNLVNSLINNLINKKLSSYNGKPINELIETYGSEELFTKLGIENTKKKLILKAVDHISGNMTTEKVTISIRLNS